MDKNNPEKFPFIYKLISSSLFHPLQDFMSSYVSFSYPLQQQIVWFNKIINILCQYYVICIIHETISSLLLICFVLCEQLLDC